MDLLNLAANTVVGRLAASNGQMEAIPFATLAGALGVGGSSYLLATNIAGTNTITGTTSTAPTLGANQVVFLIPANTNTGAATFDRDSQGTPKSVYCNNAALVGGEIQAGIPQAWFYDGTVYHILEMLATADGQAVLVNASDVTKKLKISLAGLTTGTTRTITVTDRSFTVGKQPTRTTLLTGTAATYTTPTGCTRLEIRMVGGGGGGGAQQTNAGTDGTDTTFGTLTAAKGIKGSAGAAAGGAGGAGTNGDINITGQAGQPGTNNGAAMSPIGGAGGSTPFGGGGVGGGNNATGGNAATNSGGGGGGGGGSTGPEPSGAGGGAGAYVEKMIITPATTYAYTVGAKGTGGAAGGAAGGDGAAGIIDIREFYE